MKFSKPDELSEERGFLSDRIGRTRANFNDAKPEYISISVFYATMAGDLEYNPI